MQVSAYSDSSELITVIGANRYSPSVGVFQKEFDIVENVPEVVAVGCPDFFERVVIASPRPHIAEPMTEVFGPTVVPISGASMNRPCGCI